MKWYYTYVLKSLKDSKLYVGFTDDLKSRLKRHNDGLVESTKKEDAIKREKQLKTGFCRAYLNRRISGLANKN